MNQNQKIGRGIYVENGAKTYLGRGFQQVKSTARDGELPLSHSFGISYWRWRMSIGDLTLLIP
jgi:hypothetical protein